MNTATVVVIVLVAASHIAFMVLESLLWTTPVGRKVFAMRPDQAEATRLLAANQGVYNGFLAAGLIWSLVIDDGGWAGAVATFFLTCVVVAAVVGAVTVNWRILLVQGAPAGVGLILLLG